MSIFNRGRQQPNNREQVAAYVERILHDAQIDPVSSRMTNLEGLGWQFIWGSAQIEVYINAKDNRDYFQVLSPIMIIPQSSLLPFYRRLLELNMLIPNLTFGIYGDTVYLFSERPMEGLDMGEAYDLIRAIASNADEWDNQLVNEFGGRLYRQV
jgi:hypothetical protein